MSRCRGLSLVELSIAMGLLAVIGYVALAFIAPTARSFVRTAARAELQQQALVVGNRMAADVARTAACALSYHNSTGPTDPTVLGLVPLADVDAEGKQLWASELVAYVWTPADHRVIRRVWRPGDDPALTGLVLDPQLPTWPPEEALVTLATYPAMRSDVILAGQVSGARITCDGALPPPNIQMPLRLELHLEQWAQGAEAERFDLVRDICTRNASELPVAKPTTPVP
jgi:hypothetical protein